MNDSRRDFIRVAVYGGVAVVAASLGGWAVSASRRVTSDDAFLPLAPLRRFRGIEVGEPLRAELTLSRRDGWRLRTSERHVFVVREGEGDQAEDFTVFSPVCPHAGCAVAATDEGFVCPCHDARFEFSGKRVDGPAPRDLDRLETQVREHNGTDWLFVRWQDFLPGADQPIPRRA